MFSVLRIRMARVGRKGTVSYTHLGDFGTTYDQEVLRLIDDLRSRGLLVNSVLITRFDGEPAAEIFAKKLENRGIRTYKHHIIPGYPVDVDTIVSDEGYGSNCWIETSRPIVVVTAPGPGSGKLATCLSQLYHEMCIRDRSYTEALAASIPVS